MKQLYTVSNTELRGTNLTRLSYLLSIQVSKFEKFSWRQVSDAAQAVNDILTPVFDN